MVKALMDPASYMANTGDVQNWLAILDGNNVKALLNDGRPSLYVSGADGEEFKLWDLEGLSVEEAAMMIRRPASLEGGSFLSDETMKRLGMYEILAAEGLFNESTGVLNEAAFDMFDKSAIYTPELGYYLDFQRMGLAMQEPYSDGPSFTRLFEAWFKEPTESFYLPNPSVRERILDIFTYGTMEQYGLHVKVDPTVTFSENERQNSPEYDYHPDVADGNLKPREQLNNAQSNAGGNTQYSNGMKVIYGTISNLVDSQYDKAATWANALAGVGQFGVGWANASQIGSSYVSTWDNIFGNDFYTIQTAHTVLGFGNGTLKYGYTFMSQMDLFFNRYNRQLQEKIGR